MSNIDQLTEAAAKSLIENLTSAKEFALEQAPEICRQYIQYSIIESSITIFCLILVLSVTYRLTRDFYNRTEEYGPEVFVLISAVATFASLSSMVGIIFSSHRLLMATIAPKYFLLTSLIEAFK